MDCCLWNRAQVEEQYNRASQMAGWHAKQTGAGVQLSVAAMITVMGHSPKELLFFEASVCDHFRTW